MPTHEFYLPLRVVSEWVGLTPDETLIRFAALNLGQGQYTLPILDGRLVSGDQGWFELELLDGQDTRWPASSLSSALVPDIWAIGVRLQFARGVRRVKVVPVDDIEDNLPPGTIRWVYWPWPSQPQHFAVVGLDEAGRPVM